jgi:hypothetical protein
MSSSLSLLDSIILPSLAASLEYDAQSYAQIGNLSTSTIISDNSDYPLRLSSLTDVEVEALSNVTVFIQSADNSSINFATTSYDTNNNNSRVDKTFMTMLPNETGQTLTLKPFDITEYSTLKIEYPVCNIGSNVNDELYINSRSEFTNTATFASEVYTQNFKVFKRDDNILHGYVFQINDQNRLELVKVKKTGTDVYTTSVAIFGYGDVMSPSPTENYIFTPGAASASAGPIGNTGGNTGPTSLIQNSVIPATADIDIGSTSDPINNIYSNTFHTTSPAGADFAERIEKETLTDVFVEGEIVGINSDGKLTKKFSQSIHFGIVSGTGAIIAHAGLTEENSEIIAFSGRVQVDTTGAVGEYLVPVGNSDDLIECLSIKEADMSLGQYMKSIGHVICTTESGLPYVIVKH